MTLALYGKSKKRQGSLLLAALLAILVASVGGLAIITSAFAHNPNSSASSTCSGDWASRLWYENGGSSAGDLRLVLITNVKVNNVNYDPSWASGISNSSADSKSTGNSIVSFASYSGSTTGLPTSGTQYIWVGVDTTFDIFNRNQTTGALNSSGSAWGGGATVWQWSSSNGGKWVDTGYSADVKQPPAGGDCAKIHIKKVVTGGGSSSQLFTADVNNDSNGGSGDSGSNDPTFSQDAPATYSWDEGTDTNDDFTVSEVNIPANYTVTGKYVTTGNATCPAADSGSWSASSPSAATGGLLDNLANGDEVTVCFRNNYTNPEKTIIVKKVVNAGAPAQNFSTDITNTDDTEGTINNQTFSVASPYTRTFTGGSNTDDFTVSEDAPPANWVLTGFKILDGDATCPAFDGSWSAAGTASGSYLDNLGAGETVTVCFRNQYTAPTGNIIVKKVKDTTAGVPAADGSQFSGTISGAAGWGPITFGGASGLISASAGAHTVAETGFQNAWTAVGWKVYANGNADTVCSTTNSDYTANAGASVSASVVAGQTTVVCVMNTKSAIVTDPTISKVKEDSDATTYYWKIGVDNSQSSQAQDVYIEDSGATFVSVISGGSCSDQSFGDGDGLDCTVNAYSTLYVRVSKPVPTAVCQPVDTNNTAHIWLSVPGNPKSKDLGTAGGGDATKYTKPSNPDKSCLEVKKDKSDTSQPPTWNISIKNNSDKALNVYLQDSDATLAQVVSGGSCAQGNTIMGNGVPCTVNANSTLILSVTKAYPQAATCEGTDVSNTVKVWFGTFESVPGTTPDFTVNGGTFDNLNADKSLCTHTVKVCKIVVGNGDGVVDGGQWRFGSQPSNATVLLSSQTTEPVGDATDGTQGTKNCVDLIVANTDTSIFEWGYRPGDGQGLTGTWNGDAAGYPYGYNGPLSQCSNTLPYGGTVPITSQTTEVTFCNKTLPRTEQIKIVKNFTGLNGYVPTASDVPDFTLNPSTNTSCEAPVQEDSDTWHIICTVPAGWTAAQGQVSETPKANWKKCPVVLDESLVQQIAGLVSDVLDVVIAPDYAGQFTFCNYPVGKIIVIKDDETSATNPDRPASWLFTVDGPNVSVQAPIPLGGGQFSISDVALANGYSADETNGHFNVEEACSTVSNPTGAGYQSLNQTPGTQNITYPGEEITFMFKNGDCGVVLGTGHLDVWKVRDLNGDGSMNGSDAYINWTVTIQGPEFPGGQVFNVPAGGLHLDGLTEGLYTITEGSQFGYALVGVTSNENPGLSASTATQINLHNDETDTVTFFNKPFGQIPVHKNAFTSHNGGANVAAPGDDDGWTITLTSAACGINQQAVTDSNGDALFSNLPLCTDYVVSEGAVNASSPGFVPLSASQFTNITPNGVTLTFNNILRTNDPICTNCNPSTTPTATPTTPPATATPTTPGQPTATPTEPTKEPTKTSTVSGEKTPGPGQPTPIAPSTGAGVLGGTAGGFNILLILAGLLALTSGLSFVALGRKRHR